MISTKMKILGFGLAFLLICSALSMAGGIGAYVGYDMIIGGVGYFDTSNSFTRTKIIQAGIMFDTNVARNSLFNYRLQVGLDMSTASFYDQWAAQQIEINIWQISFTNTFGFGLARSELMRIWAGPQIGIGIGFEPTFSHSYYATTNGSFFEMDLFLGIAMGMNLHITDSISIVGDVSLRIHEDMMVAPSTFFAGLLIKGSASAGILFKFDDVYVSRE